MNQPETEAHEKRCPKCRRTLPATEFYKNSNSRDGLDWWCKWCKRSSTIQNRGIKLRDDINYMRDVEQRALAKRPRIELKTFKTPLPLGPSRYDKLVAKLEEYTAKLPEVEAHLPPDRKLANLEPEQEQEERCTQPDDGHAASEPNELLAPLEMDELGYQ